MAPKRCGFVKGKELISLEEAVGKWRAAVDVRKSITFCRHLQVNVLGVVENMSGFVCPKCGEVTPIFSAGGGKKIAESMQVPFLGSIPTDPKIGQASDSGQVFIHKYNESPTAEIMRQIIKPILELDSDNK